MSVEDVPPLAGGHLSTVLRIDPAAHGPLRVVVLISGGGSNLAALLEAAKKPDYGVQIVAVGSDRPGAGGLDIASSAGVPTFVERLQDHSDRHDWDRALTARVASHTPDLVLSAGFLKLVGPEFLGQFSGRYLNTHNALLPSFPGIHGPREALEYGVRITGATLFFVDEGIDTGPILAQVAVPVENDDTVDSLTERIKRAERRQLVEQVGRLARFGWTIQDRKVTAGMSDTESSAADARSGPAGGESNAGQPGGRIVDSAPAGSTVAGHDAEALPSAERFASQSESSTAPEPRDPEPARTGDGRRRLRRALLSVSDKTGLVELARALAAGGVALVSTGNSARTIADAGIEVTPVEQVTGAPEFLDGRVKTLHPAIHGGLLADTRNPSHLEQLAQRGIDAFDLVVSNLYPFRQTLASGAPQDEVIEQIDIGGPAMIRASAKNHASVAVVVEPADYALAVDALNAGGFTFSERQTLAAKAFAHTASYDVAVASWLNGVTTPADGWPLWTGSTWQRQAVLRYGENPHQQAALYRHWRSGLAGAKQLHGKDMSYNNYVDVDAAWRAAADFDDPAAAIIKHSNPCGIAIIANGEDDAIAAAHARALACDPVSAFGGVVAVNRTVTTKMAEQVAEVFTEVLLAPGFEEGALAVLTRKKNIRLLVMPADSQPDPAEFRAISGGILAQLRDNVDAPGDDPATWTLAAGNQADAETLADLTFAWRACRSVKSNAILLAAGGASVGIGMGQVNRVDSAMLAVQRAGSRAAGAVAASDAFFPFADGLEILLRAGVRAVVQPGGSVRDAEVIAAAEAAGATLYLTGTRHFFH